MRPIVLRRLLSCAVLAWAATGAGRAAQPIIPEGNVVTLPPLLVEAKTLPLKWRYFKEDELEVLAATSDGTAADFVTRTRRLNLMVETILPARFRARTAGPETLVLIDQTKVPTTARDVLDEVGRQRNRTVRYLPNVRLTDRDAVVVLAMLGGESAAPFGYSEERIVDLMQRRTPRLPDWFTAGMTEFYRGLTFNERDIATRPLTWYRLLFRAGMPGGTDFPRTLLPLEEMLTHRASPAPSNERERLRNEREQIWRSQCTLFMFWTLVHENGVRREAMWKFLDRLEQEPLSEELFIDCFGVGYSDMRDQLSDYLPKALGPQQRISVAAPDVRQRRPAFRDATELEVARIRGDMERLEANYVRPLWPEHVGRYLDQARRTLHLAYDQGQRDPQLLAIMGLTELEAGDLDTALPLLEAAVAGRVPRARVYFEVARLRYAVFLKATPGEANRRLTPDQVEAVTTPLLAAHALEPPLFEVYALLADALSRGATTPGAAPLEALHEGARRFPHATELMARTILLHRAAGQPAAAAALRQLGLRYAPDAAARTRIEQASGGTK